MAHLYLRPRNGVEEEKSMLVPTFAVPGHPAPNGVVVSIGGN